MGNFRYISDAFPPFIFCLIVSIFVLYVFTHIFWFHSSKTSFFTSFNSLLYLLLFSKRICQLNFNWINNRFVIVLLCSDVTNTGSAQTSRGTT